MRITEGKVEKDIMSALITIVKSLSLMLMQQTSLFSFLLKSYGLHWHGSLSIASDLLQLCIGDENEKPLLDGQLVMGMQKVRTRTDDS
jgi:hypothetical protein